MPNGRKFPRRRITHKKGLTSGSTSLSGRRSTAPTYRYRGFSRGYRRKAY